MDSLKFENKIVGKITNSLKIQNLHNKLVIKNLVETRDRYFLVEGINGTKRKKKFLFIRYEKYFFYVPNLKTIPKDYDKRHYLDKVRTVNNRDELSDIGNERKRERV